MPGGKRTEGRLQQLKTPLAHCAACGAVRESVSRDAAKTAERTSFVEIASILFCEVEKLDVVFVVWK